MTKLNSIVVDDEPLARDLISSYVEKTPFLHLTGKYSDATEALSALKSQDVDVLFLDIQMPDLNGLELATLIDKKRTRIIFITAYEKYALEGFKVEALDYLLKPVSYVDFLHSAQRAWDWFRQNKNTEVSTGNEKTIFVKADAKWIQLYLKDILYIEGLKDYIKIYLDPFGKSSLLSSNTPYCILTLQSMKGIEEYLPKSIFLRIHRSYIVNMDHVQCVERNRIVFGKEYLPISDSYKKDFDAAMTARMIKE